MGLTHFQNYLAENKFGVEQKIDMKKPGYKTTEFWMSSVAMLIGLAYGSGIITEAGTSGIEKSVAFIASALAALGYSASRGNVKAAEIESKK